jgi:glutamyl-tRNA synthetase
MTAPAPSPISSAEVSVEWATIPDFVIVRSDGTPLFFLANAVDDIEMAITHVIRGEDLLDTTHRVLALRRHSVQPTARRTHLPLIVGADRAKLSKRHGAVALEEFRDAGYLPEALLNYLALLGWGPEDGARSSTGPSLSRSSTSPASSTHPPSSTIRSWTG